MFYCKFKYRNSDGKVRSFKGDDFCYSKERFNDCVKSYKKAEKRLDGCIFIKNIRRTRKENLFL